MTIIWNYMYTRVPYTWYKPPHELVIVLMSWAARISKSSKYLYRTVVVYLLSTCLLSHVLLKETDRCSLKGFL